MRKHRPTKHDLEHVPWAPPPEPPRYVSQMFYGRVVVAHYHDDVIREIGKRLRPHLEEIARDMDLRAKPIFRVEWVLDSDGRVSTDAVMDPATGEWARPGR